MRKFVCTVLPVLAIALVLGAGTALAQDSIYDVTYFSNAHTSGAPDGVLRLVNDGFVSDSSPAGDLCASIYVFDSTEELNECCSCRITPNGILSLSVNANLTSNTLTGRVPARGVIKEISSLPTAGVCDPTTFNPSLGIKGWQTHIQRASSSAFSITEEELADSSLSAAEAADLAEDCTVLIELGSGAGRCSCSDSKQ